MRHVLIVLLLCGAAIAQTKAAPSKSPSTPDPAKPAATPAQKSSPATASPAQPTGEVPPNTPVITVKGLCEKPAAGTPCSTTITRAEFEKVLMAVNPGKSPLPPGAPRNIATRYVQLLALVDEAKKLGLDKTPQGQDFIRFASMQALAQLFTVRVQEQATATDAEIKKFYDDNAVRLREATVRRVFVPVTATAEATAVDAKGAKDAKAADPKMKETADKLYAAAKSPTADFDALQKQAFETAGIKTAPETKMVVLPDSVPPGQASIFELKPGEVSQMFTEPSGYYFYKLEKLQPVPFEQIREDIKATVERQKIQSAMESVLKKPEPVLNEKYFGSEQPAQGFGTQKPQPTPPQEEPK